MLTVRPESASISTALAEASRGDVTSRALARLAVWLETMRGTAGYTGPVVHWWQSVLLFTGVGLDWRYEGVITGYLNLHQATGADCWLRLACRAGDDLVAGQLPHGNFRNSAFELNPATGGTPHEAACDLALLRLALRLRQLARPEADVYFEAARTNLTQYHMERLWQDQYSFGEPSAALAFVPNKAATIAEALFLCAQLSGESGWQDYALAGLERLLRHQRSGRLEGAISQYSEPAYPHGQDKYFPFYIARCVPALLHAGRITGGVRFIQAAERALRFILAQQRANGSFPQVAYAGGKYADYPTWVAGLADILRVLHEAQEQWPDWGALVWAEQRGRDYLLAGQLPSGGFRSGYGFAAQVSQQRRDIRGDDLRDLLPVCGWNDKVFAYLSAIYDASSPLPPAEVADWELPCTYAGQPLICAETAHRIYVRRPAGEIVYDWVKGEEWAALCHPMFYRR